MHSQLCPIKQMPPKSEFNDKKYIMKRPKWIGFCWIYRKLADECILLD